MNALSQKIVCPFCFASFGVQKIVFRCLNPRCSGRAEDLVYARARGGQMLAAMGHVLPSSICIMSVGVRSLIQCTLCKKDTPSRLCPE